jgi:hypothetical protein
MFRPTFEYLERREVFSGEPLPMQGISLNVASEAPIPDFTLNVGPELRQLGGDFNGDADVDAADYVLIRTRLMGTFDSDGRPDLAVKSPRESASGLATGIMAAVETGVDVTSIGLNALASSRLLDDLIGWDFRSHFIDNVIFDRMGILPYIEQDNLYKLGSLVSGAELDQNAATGARDAAFNQHGQSNGIIAVLIGLVHNSPDRIAVDPSDPSGNTLVQRRASVTDLVIDPFDSNILIVQ